MIPTQYNSRHQELYHHWFRAEEAIKTFERLDGRVVMPSVQELRYAGRRLAQVLAMCDKRNGALGIPAQRDRRIRPIVTDQSGGA